MFQELDRLVNGRFAPEDISALMSLRRRRETSRPTGDDNFAQSDEAKLGCLLLEKVTGGRPRADQSRLLSLPAEILASIVDMLSASDLASLALVNSDCQHLARSGQFSDIHFDYSQRAQSLAEHLLSDVTHVINNKGTKRISIGSCVRRVTFASNPNNVSQCHPEILSDESDFRSDEENCAIHKTAYVHYRHVQVSSLAAVSALTMPNLEVLKWGDDFLINEDFFKLISLSSAQHVILDWLRLRRPIPLRPLVAPTGWPLRKLDLDMSLPRESDGKPVGVGFYEDFLRLCAPTLESLKLNERDSRVSQMVFFKDQNPPSFPRLRDLRLRVLDPPTSFLSLFMDSPVRSLEIPQEIRHPNSMAAMIGDGFRDLETLAVPDLPFKDTLSEEIARFLQEHKKIQKLCVHENNYVVGSRAHLDHYIIPVLAKGGFECLTSLSLHWFGAFDETQTRVVHVPEASLAVVSQITSLQKLKLGAGETSSARPLWLVDHESVARLLRPLQNLQVLAFYRDTYQSLGYGDPDVEDYYTRQTLTEAMWAIASERPEFDAASVQRIIEDNSILHHEIWERAHRNRMLNYAEGYASILPALETMVCGQLPMAIRCNPQEPKGTRKAVPLTERRDTCFSYLCKTFGLARWLETVERR
ncbi:unnamed protein product [Clonostachys byssicola]|uniref:F-box domain-containing protein n=1 Tax=Clonostachys byssicola TaxID=160290 RepID=A0A9N9U3P1_9HYPO|nr:unnamed protein product [Clonostachys byssicola]